MNKAIDAFDVRLLNLLQESSIATSEELAERVPLSPSAISRRVRRLRSEGLIAADVAVLAPELIRDRIQAVVHVSLHEHAEHRGLTRLRERLRNADEVQICYEVSGTFDLMLIIVARGMADFNAFADDVLASDPTVRRYETSFVKKAIKSSLAVCLDERDAAR